MGRRESSAFATEFNGDWPQGRAATIFGTVIALAAVVSSGFLLFSIVHGYLLAVHHQLPPNSTFGFRDSTTRSSLPAWYAAQQAGFSWLLFCGGPILALNIAFGVFAFVKRRSPWDVFGISLLALILLLVVTVVAGIHADGTAKRFSQVHGATCAPCGLFA
jgi:hypothetical protein